MRELLLAETSEFVTQDQPCASPGLQEHSADQSNDQSNEFVNTGSRILELCDDR